MLKDAICVSGGENVDTSAELLTRAIEGKSVDDLYNTSVVSFYTLPVFPPFFCVGFV
jgi:hypothetical protein